MAKILNFKLGKNNKINLTVELNNEEFKWLGGNLNNIFIFSIKNLVHESRLIKRGKKEATKYFLLPRVLREGITTSKYVTCNCIKSEKYYIYLFKVPRKD